MIADDAAVRQKAGARDVQEQPTLESSQSLAREGKGQGILLHSLTDAAGMPLAHRTTPAHGNERAPVLPRLDAVRLRTGKPGRPSKRPKVLATDQGDDAKALRLQLRNRGLRAWIPKRVWKTTKSRGRPIKMDVPRFQAERTFAWFQKKYRRVVVRWEQLTACFTALLAIATIHIWIQALRRGKV